MCLTLVGTVQIPLENTGLEDNAAASITCIMMNNGKCGVMGELPHATAQETECEMKGLPRLAALSLQIPGNTVSSTQGR